MPYEFLEDVATADVAFIARGESIEDLFCAAADATMNVMVTDLSTIDRSLERSVNGEAEALDLLLVNWLQELIYYKDAQRLLLRAASVTIERGHKPLRLSGVLSGEPMNPQKHELNADVKAVTLHRLRVEQTPKGWEAFVILDI